MFPWRVGGGDVKNHVMWCGEMKNCGDKWYLKCDVMW